MKNAGIAAVLSFFISGLGQIYNGQIIKGLVIILVQVVNGILTGILIGWIPLAIVWVWAIFDAYFVAERKNTRFGLR
jgi:TM2 domain-containing membrane protein YozV